MLGETVTIIMLCPNKHRCNRNTYSSNIPANSPRSRTLHRTPNRLALRYELSRETELKSGTLYPILMRLAKFSLLEPSG